MAASLSLIITNKHLQWLVFFSLSLLLICGQAMAKDVVLSKNEIRIPIGQSQTFDLGTLPQKDTTVLIDILARLDFHDHAGSNYSMKIVLNGHLVNAAKSRDTVRLINKNLISPGAPNAPYRWFDNEAWRVLYAPSFKGSLKKHQYYEGNPYQTVLDVTDLINPAAENRLEIFNTSKSRPSTGTGKNLDLVLKSLTIKVKPGSSAMMTASALGQDQDVINPGLPGAGPARYTGILLPGGGFKLNVDGRSMKFSSFISYPDAGINKLTPTDRPSTDGQANFQVTTQPTADGGKVVAIGPDYRIIRTVRFTSRKVEVNDQITNLRQNVKLGLMFENVVKLEDANPKVRLAGIPDNSINQYYSPGNPTVYVALPSLGLGLICEDDVFRNQATLFFDTGKMMAGLRTDKLCLQPGQSYTLSWSVYPVASNDYYDFINLVRQDWGSNYTVEGAWTFFDPDSIIATPVETIREQFARLGIKRACSGGGWVDRQHDPKRIGFGSGVLEDYWANYRYRLRLASEKIHQAAPDCRVYLYFDTQRDTSEGGHERFADSWLSNEKGNQLATEWGGKYSLTRSVVATDTNSFGKTMLAAVDRYIEEMKSDGLYWDEMEGTGYGEPLVAYNIPDGFSCELDPKTFTIKREIGINTIMGEAHRIAVINRVRELGGDIMGNGATATKKILALHPQRMIEIQHNEYWNYQGNLQSPLGYAGSRPDFGNWIRALNMATLLVGTRYDYTYDLQRFVFPFTPIELHPGYMLGEERIIATHNGNYGWPGKKNIIQIRYLDTSGKLSERDFPTRVGSEARTRIEVGKDEAVVLVKLPVTVMPTQGLTTIQRVRYGPDGLVFAAETVNDFSVEITTGEMKVIPGQKYIVNVENGTQTVEANANGILTINLQPKSASFIVKITPLEPLLN